MKVTPIMAPFKFALHFLHEMHAESLKIQQLLSISRQLNYSLFFRIFFLLQKCVAKFCATEAKVKKKILLTALSAIIKLHHSYLHLNFFNFFLQEKM